MALNRPRVYCVCVAVSEIMLRKSEMGKTKHALLSRSTIRSRRVHCLPSRFDKQIAEPARSMSIFTGSACGSAHSSHLLLYKHTARALIISNKQNAGRRANVLVLHPLWRSRPRSQRKAARFRRYRGSDESGVGVCGPVMPGIMLVYDQNNSY